MSHLRRNKTKSVLAGLVAICLIGGTLPTSALTAVADDGWEDPYAYHISRDSLTEAIEEAVDEDSLLYEQIAFSGDNEEEYKTLFSQDGTLYELSLDTLDLEESTERDEVLGLRAFVRVAEPVSEEESYVVDGSEEVVFLLENRSTAAVTVKIYLDNKESRRITVLSAGEIVPTEEAEGSLLDEDASEQAQDIEAEPDDGEAAVMDVAEAEESEAGSEDAQAVEEAAPEEENKEAVSAEETAGAEETANADETVSGEAASADSEEERSEPVGDQVEPAAVDDGEETAPAAEEETALDAEEAGTEDADAAEEQEEAARELPDEEPIASWKLLDGTIYNPVCVGDNGAAAFATTLGGENEIMTLADKDADDGEAVVLSAEDGQVIDGYGTILVKEQISNETYTINVNDVPTNTNISLGSKNIVVTNEAGETLSGISLAGKLYYVSNDAESWTQVSYLELDGSKKGETVTDNDGNTKTYYEVVPYDADDRAFDMSKGSLYLRNASVVSARADIMPLQAEMLCEQTGYGDDDENTDSGYTQTFISAKEMTGNPQVFYYPGYEDDVIEMSVLTNGSAEEFYWGSLGSDGSIDDLHEFEYAKIVNIGENTAGAEVYYLYPSDAEGNVPDDYDHDTSKLYMKYDVVYSFDVILNSIVNELTEDNGDVYLWKGDTYYVDQYHNMGGTSNGYSNYSPSPSNNWDSGVWDQLALGKANGSYEDGVASFDGEGREYAINNGLASFSNYSNVSASDAGEVIRQSGSNKISTSSSRKYGIVGPYTVEDGATDVTTSKVRITGHIGDKFTPMEAFGESRVYLVNDEEKQLHSDWFDIGARPSDGGTRAWWYWINDYYKLNNYDDELEFIEIAEREDKESGEMQVRLEADEVGESEDALEEYDIWDAKLFIKRESVIKTDMLNNKTDYTSNYISFQANAGRPHHIQLRMNGNFETVIDGVTYSGELSVLSDEDENGNVNTEEGSKAPYVEYTVPYTEEDGSIGSLTESAYLGIDNEQESKIYYFGGASGSSYYVPNDLIYDTSKVKIHARINFTGTITSTNGDKYEYTEDNPFVYENDLTENELREAYDACPNKAGYDLAVNLADALVSEVDVEPETILYKIWDDDDNARGSRGNVDEVDVNLERSKDGETWETVYDRDDPSKVAEFIIPAPEDENGNVDWSASQWSLVLSEEDLDLSYTTDDGDKAFYEFRISKEELEEGEETAEGFTYNTTIVGTTVTNTLVHDTATIEGEKLWYGDTGKELTDIPVDNVTITLYQDGHYYERTSVSADNDWKFEFTDLPIWNGTEKYVYTVGEMTSDGRAVGDKDTVLLGNEWFDVGIEEKDDGSYSITNTLLTGSLDISKHVVESTPASHLNVTFTVVITAETKGVDFECVSVTDNSTGAAVTYTAEKDAGTISFAITNDQAVTLSGLPIGSYTVEETHVESDDFRPVYRVGDEETEEAPTVDIEADSEETETVAVEIDNEYPITTSIQVQKNYGSTVYPQGENAFTFTIEALSCDLEAEDVTLSEMPMPAESTITVTSGDAVAFDQMEFKHLGTYYYKITETQGNLSYVTAYDSSVYYVKIVVSFDEESDKGYYELTAAESYSKAESETNDYKDLEYTSVDGIVTVEFTNFYSAAGDVTLTATKTISGMNSTVKTFDFALYNSNENFTYNIGDLRSTTSTTDTLTEGAARTVTFPAITYTEPGIYYFVIKETSNGTEGDGWTYDETEYQVTVEMRDNGDGTLSPYIVAYEYVDENGDTQTTPSADFTNTYKAAETSVQFAGTKYISNSNSTDKEFAFELYETEDSSFDTADVTPEEVTTSGSIDASGQGYEFGKLTYDEAGTHYYVIKEQELDSAKGWTISDKVYYITVNVTDNLAGQLEATVTYVTEIGGDSTTVTGSENVYNGFDFTNTYAASGSVALTAVKSLEGRATSDRTFTFGLYNSDKDFNAGTEIEEKSTSDTIEGSQQISFTELKYEYDSKNTYPMYYYYIIKETTEDGSGWTCDTGEYHVTVTVTDDETGVLTTSPSYVYVDADEAETSADNATFTNTYAATSALDLSGTKTFEGGTIEDGQFTYTVMEGDKQVATGTVDEDGMITFTQINYTYSDLGEHIYTVKEDMPEGATADSGYIFDGVKYDPTAYTVVATVTDNETGELGVSYTVNGEENGTIDFTNYQEGSLIITKTFMGLTEEKIESLADDFTITVTSSNGETVATLTLADADEGSDYTWTISNLPADTYTVTETGYGLNGYEVIAESGDVTVTDGTDLSVDDTLAWGGEDTVAFTNAYTEVGSLKVSKHVVEGTQASHLDVGYTVVITAQSDDSVDFRWVIVTDSTGDAVAYTTDEEENNITFTIQNGQTLTVSGLPAGSYTVEETVADNEDSFTPIYRVGGLEKEDSPTVTVTSGEENIETVEIDNEYPIGTYIQVKKNYNNTIYPQDSDAFTFTIEALSFEPEAEGVSLTADEMPMPTNTSVSIADGNAVSFGQMEFEHLGTYYYKITETKGDLDYIDYDSSVYYVKVVVSFDEDADEDYYLETAEESYCKVEAETAEYKDLEYTVVDTIVTAEFENTYSAAGDVTLTATKEYTGAELTKGLFAFTITETTDGATYSGTGTNDADGNVTFEPAIEYTFDDVGTHIYEIAETAGDAGGVTYDTEPIIATVEVTDNGNGTLSTTVTVDGSEIEATDGTYNVGTFNNSYEANGGLTLTAAKEYTGATLKEGLFDFTITETTEGIEEENLYTAKGTNDADGNITFDPAIAYTLDDVGEHTYEIAETAGNAGGVTYDPNKITVTVDVTDNGNGTLSATVTKDGVTLTAGDNGSYNVGTFENSYRAKGSVTFGGEKTISGLDNTNQQFTFALYTTDDTFTVDEDADATDKKTVTGAGSYEFAAIAYDSDTENGTGTYYYLVKETSTDENGWTMDTTEYRITVVVSDAGNGTFKLDVSCENADGETVTLTQAEDGSDSFTGLDFSNSYKAAETSVQFTGTKYITNSASKNESTDKVFTFELYDADSSFTTFGDAIDTRTTTGAGSIAFDEITYEETGIHYYVMKEKALDALEGWTIDTKVYNITVTVTDDEQGHLIATVTANGESVTGTDDVYGGFDFTNSYSAAGDVTLTTTKTISGMSSTVKTFDFALYNSNENFTYNIGDVRSTVSTTGTLTEEETQTVTFPTINYTLAGTYYYVIIETSKGIEGDGWTYDTKEYHVTVDMRDNGDGTLSPYLDTIVYQYEDENGELQTAASADFTNTYKAAAASVQFTGTKYITNSASSKESTDKVFTFELFDADSSFAADGDAIQTKTTTGAGSIIFDEITYDEPGTHYYVIQEKALDAAAGWMVDSKVYNIVVEVEDNYLGQLVATVTVNGTEAAGTDNVYGGFDFTNAYAAEGSVTLGVVKSISGVASTEETFEFTLYGSDESFATGYSIETIKTDDTIEDSTALNFTSIPYTAAGIYYYVIKETGTAADGWTLDAKEYHVTVTVTDNDDGTLSTSASYAYADENNEPQTENSAAFTNAYAASGKLTLTGTKTLTGGTLEENGFTFTMTDSTGESVGEATMDADGNITFPTLSYDETDIGGEYAYTIAEVNTNDSSVQYDETSYTVVISVADNKDGTLDVTYTVNGEPNGDITFDNYQKGKLTITKTFTGLTEKQITSLEDFTITVTDSSGETVAALTLDAADEGSAYTWTIGNLLPDVYTVTESGYSLSGYEVIAKSGDVTVTNGSDLFVEYDLAWGVEDTVAFTNDYTEVGSLDISKHVVEGTQASHLETEYTVVVTANADTVDFQWVTITVNGEDVTSSAAIDAEEKTITFPISNGQKATIDGLPAGSYTVEETVSEGDDFEPVYRVGGHETEQAPTVIVSSGTENVVTVEIDNEYPIGTYIQVKKNYNTDYPTDSDAFTFTIEALSCELEAEDVSLTAKDMPMPTTSTITVTSDSTESFGMIAFEHFGTYYYKVTETKGDLEYIDYDPSVYYVKIVVSFDENANEEYYLETAEESYCKCEEEVEDYKGLTYIPTTSDNPIVTAEFTNTYSAEGGLSLTATKKLSGAALTAGQFTFTITETTEGATYSVTGTNDADGNITFTPAIEYTLDDVGTHTYEIAETIGDAGGVIYDSNKITVTVDVTDNGDGTLSTKVIANDSEIEATDGSYNVGTFENTYEATGGLTLTASKEYTGAALEAGLFDFTITETTEGTEEENLYTATGTNNADGNITFEPAIAYTLDDVGTHTYKIAETEGTAGGVIYDTNTMTVTVEVTDNGNGTLSAAVTKDGDTLTAGEDGSYNVGTFENSYRAKGSVTFGGEKTISGLDNTNQQFTFALYTTDDTFTVDEDADATDTKTVTGAGSYEFAAIAYDSDTENGEGTYYYLIKETSTDENGWTMDTNEYRITVVVTDAGDGTFTLDVTCLDTDDETVTLTENGTNGAYSFTGLDFANSYKAAETSVQFTGTKYITNSADTKKVFTFELYEADDETFDIAGETPMQTKSTEGEITSEGKNFLFDAITYTEAGTYYYVIQEQALDAPEGWTIDSKVYDITVTVTDDERGHLVATVKANGEHIIGDKDVYGGFDFTNAYAAEGDVTLGVVKSIHGVVSTEKEFEFTLYNSDESFAAGSSIETITTDGMIENSTELNFTAIPYTEAGTYYYVITETGMAPDGWTLDEKEYHVTVTVTDNIDGTLTTSAFYAYEDADGETQTENSAAFTNIYAANGSLNLSGTKTYAGLDPAENSFTFTVKEGDTTVSTGTADEDGTITFTQIDYTLDDVGGHTYVVTEDIPDGATADNGYIFDGVKYDPTEYTVAVTVADNGDGTLDVTYTVNGEENGSISFKNTRMGTININGVKDWDDDNDRDGLRPSSITINLVANGVPAVDEEGNPITITVYPGENTLLPESPLFLATDTDEWSWSIPNLPKYDNDGIEIIYTIEENLNFDGYTTTITGDMTDGFVITNSHNIETTSLSGTKTWDDANNQDGKRPASITINLLADGEPALDADGNAITATVTADDDWSWTFTDLPKYRDGGVEIIYSITEDEVNGYTTEVNGFDVTNTHVPETTEIAGSKTWDDANNQDGKRPASITIRLYADGTEIDSATVTEADEWSWTFTDLPKYRNGGVEIDYTITEDAIDEYDTTYDGYNVTNSYTPGMTSLSVVKIWNDADDQDGLRPSSVTVELLADGAPTGTVITLDESNHWRGSFTDLPIYEAGTEIRYTYEVREVSPEQGYTEEETGGMEHGYVITNSHGPETIEVTGSKTWNDADNQDGMRPENITIRLYADGKEIDTATVTADDDWSWNFTDLPKYRDGGIEIAYTITEDAVDHYATEYDGYNVTNTHTLNKTSVTVTKAWNDSDDQDGIRPDSVTVVLLADGEETGKTLELNESNSWTDTFTDLDMYRDHGEAIVYTVGEYVPAGYEVAIIGDATTGYTVTNTHTPVVGTEPLSISKEVSGESEISEYEFRVTLNVDGTAYSGDVTATRSGGAEETVTFADGVATVTIKAGETLTLNIPSGAQWEVYELTDDADSVLINVDGNIVPRPADRTQPYAAEGTIRDATQVVFINSYRQYFPIDEEIVTNEENIFDRSAWVKEEAVNEYNAIEIEMTTTLPVITVYDLENGAFTMNFHEVLDHELVLDEVDTDFSVYIDEQKISHDYYTVTLAPEASALAVQPYSVSPADDGCTFHVDVDLTALYLDGVITEDDLKGDTEITIFFFADLEGTGLNGTYKSTIWYDVADGDDILYTSNEDVVEVYTYEIDIQKYDSETGDAVEGARLGVYYDEDCTDPVIRSGEPYTVVSGENGRAIFYGLANGTYYVTELEAPAGYELSDEVLTVELGEALDGSGHVFTGEYANKPEGSGPLPETVDVNGSKTWVDNDDQDGKRPESITIHLLADEEVVDTVTVTEEDGWAWSFTGLDKYDADDNEITYSITEDEVDNYTTEVNGYDVTNTYESTPETEKTSVSVKKEWNDSNNADGIRPESVNVELYKNGESTGRVLVLNEDNDWSGSFDNLDEETDGVKNVYTVQEQDVEGYTAAITGDAETGFVVTNTHSTDNGTEPKHTTSGTGDTGSTGGTGGTGGTTGSTGGTSGVGTAKTDDAGNAGMWLAVVIAAAAVAACSVVVRTRRQKTRK